MFIFKSNNVLNVLKRSGYCVHHDGIFAGGMIRNICGGRWHAKLLSPIAQGRVEIHYDNTKLWYHRMRTNSTKELLELSRLKQTEKKLYSND
jgi:hypothetical protein